MKRGNSMKDRDERSRGIATRIADAFVIIKPTTPFRLAKHEALRKRNCSDSSGNSPVKTDVSWCEYKNQSNKIIIQEPCNVHCQRNEDNWVWSIQVKVTIMSYFNPDHCFYNPIWVRITIWAPCVRKLTHRVKMWAPESNMCHREIRYQGVRRRLSCVWGFKLNLCLLLIDKGKQIYFSLMNKFDLEGKKNPTSFFWK